MIRPELQNILERYNIRFYRFSTEAYAKENTKYLKIILSDGETILIPSQFVREIKLR